MTNDDYDPDKYGERGGVAGRPDLDCHDGIDHLAAILSPGWGLKMASKAEQARRWARDAMEALSGPDRVALACAPRITFPTPDEVDAMWRREQEEARRNAHE